jgi:hypothetical protein
MIRLQLDEAAGDGALAGWREDGAESGRADHVMEAVAAVVQGMLQRPGIETRRVVGIETDGVDGEVAPVADETRCPIAGAGDLSLISGGLVPIDIAVEIEQAVVGPRIGPARGRELVARAGRVDRRRRRRSAGWKRLAGGVGRVVVDITELELVPERRAERSLHHAGVHLVVGVRDDVAVAVSVALLRAVGAAREQFGGGSEARGRKRRGNGARGRTAHRMGQHAPAFADLEDIFDVLGAERGDTADRAGAEQLATGPRITSTLLMSSGSR